MASLLTPLEPMAMYPEPQTKAIPSPTGPSHMSGRKNFNRHEQQKKSNHFVGPEPVLMVRSGSRAAAGQHSNSSALALIDELIEERRPARSEEPIASDAEERGEGRRMSRRGSQASLASERKSSLSRDRISARSRTASQDRLQQAPPQYYYRDGEDYDDDGYEQQRGERTAYMSAQERQHAYEYTKQRRSRRPTREDEEDWELRKRAKKVWGRSAYHPKTILQGTWDYVSSRRVVLFGLLAVLAAILLVGGLVAFLVWPRAVSIKFLDIDHDQNPEPYRIVPKEQGVHLRVHSWVNVQVHNPNFFEARIKKSSVIANWVMFDGRKDMFGGSIIDEERTLKKREKYKLRLPITIEYFGSPKEDPIYKDFLERCYDGYGDGKIYLNFQIEVTTLAKDIEKTGIIHVDRSMACPMGKDQIKKTLDTLFGQEISPAQPQPRKRR